MQIYKYFITIVLLLCFKTVQASRVKVAILELTSNINKIETEVIKTRLQKGLFKQQLIVYNVSRKDIINSLKKLYRKKTSTENQVVKIGRSIKADFVIWGEIKKAPNGYTITINTLDVNDQKIIYSKKIIINSLDDLSLHIPVISAIISERIYYRRSKKYPHNITATTAYFHANESFKGVIRNGYGFGLNYNYQFLNCNCLAGIDTRFFIVDGDKDVTEIGYLVPITAFIGYKYKFKYFSIVPLVHTGTMYNQLHYYTNVQKDSYYKQRFWRYLSKFGMGINVPIYDPVALMCNYELGMLYDNGIRTYQTVSFGVQLSFW